MVLVHTAYIWHIRGYIYSVEHLFPFSTNINKVRKLDITQIHKPAGFNEGKVTVELQQGRVMEESDWLTFYSSQHHKRKHQRITFQCSRRRNT